MIQLAIREAREMKPPRYMIGYWDNSIKKANLAFRCIRILHPDETILAARDQAKHIAEDSKGRYKF